jgi:uncharacterized protein (UPF0276 family)
MSANHTCSSVQPRPDRSSAGFGVGLRTPHYSEFLAAKQPLDWLEIITDNFLVDGGKPLRMLDRIRRDYPVAMHGVAMSIGAAKGIDLTYLHKVKALAARIEPLWVSDHLCWIGPGPEQLHDLYPLPYTDEAARHVIEQIQHAQDVLQRQLVIENVSSYIQFAGEAASEWQFLSHIAQAADCLLLVDVNNIFVSSVNHSFDPLDYLNALPAQRVQQIHLAGHSDHGDYVVDTHDHPVAAPVWDLYRHACLRFGSVATMIERDDEIPPLSALLEELDIARKISNEFRRSHLNTQATVDTHSWPDNASPVFSNGVSLAHIQQQLGHFILDRVTPSSVLNLVDTTPPSTSEQRLDIYHHAYRARLVEVLTDSFVKTNLYMGSEVFANDASQFVVNHPPLTRSLGRYGADLPAFLSGLYPDNPELVELAQLDWDLRSRFDLADEMAIDANSASAMDWLTWPHPLHTSLVLRKVRSNVVELWRAIDADTDVPQVVFFTPEKWIAVWRKELQPHFQTLDSDEAHFLNQLQAGQSIDAAAATLGDNPGVATPQMLAVWLENWLQNGMLTAKT